MSWITHKYIHCERKKRTCGIFAIIHPITNGQGRPFPEANDAY